MDGWISLHRKFLEWEWWSDDKMVKLFIYCLLKANRKDGSWRGVKLIRGQFATGLNTLTNDTGITKQSLRTCLRRLKDTNEINIESTNKYSIITVCNYDSYQNNKPQSNTQNNTEPADDQQSNNNPSTTNNTGNTINTEINKYKKMLLSEINSDEFKKVDSKHLEIAIKFQQLFIKNQSDAGIKNSTLKKANGIWIDQIRLMIDTDKRTIAQLVIIYDFLKVNDFWKSNILSTKKLREQFEKLIMQAKQEKSDKKNVPQININ